MIKTGDQVPHFTAKNQHGVEINDIALKGNKYILFFYGQDDTPTCSKQVFSANDVASLVTSKGYMLFGVSPDSVKKHQKFIEKYDLKIDLLSDPDKKMMYDFVAYGPKIFMGKEVTGVYRKAYFINENGKVENILTDVVSADQGKLIKEVLGIS
jgi:thioredoxin-dependent peroxiredoxin